MLMSKANVVLVTNVAQGFGRAIALAYGLAQHDVVCADRDVDMASKTAAEIEELGGQAIPIQADMTTQMDVYNAFNKVFEIFGHLSGVIHVATQESHTPFHTLSEAEFAELFAEDLKSSFLTLKTASRLLDQAWIVLVTPPRDASEPQMSAVRGALTRLAASFSAQRQSIRVNVVVPSRAATDPKHDDTLVKTVLHLGSDEAEGVAGHQLFVTLPPPPQAVETLLPEVRAALDETVRQDDLEASIFGEFVETLDDQERFYIEPGGVRTIEDEDT